MYSPKEVSAAVRKHFATAQQPHSRDIFINQKILPLDKVINQQEGIPLFTLKNIYLTLNQNYISMLIKFNKQIT